MASGTINLPKGFVLDKPSQPEGFVIDKPDVKLPKGFVLDKPNAQQSKVSVDDLFNKLEGLQKEYQKNGILGRFQGTGGDILKRSYESKIKDLTDQLNKQGINNETIKTAQAIKVKVDAPRYGSMAGGVVGGIALPAALGATGWGIPVAAMIGAGFGGVAGEAAQTGMQEKRLSTPKELLHEFTVNALSEGVGRGVAKGIRAATKGLPLVGVKQTVPEAAAVLEDYAKVGGVFTPKELDQRLILSAAEGASRGSFFSKEIWDGIEKKEGVAARAFANNIIDSIADRTALGNPTEIGQILAEGIKPNGKIVKMLDEVVNPLYKQVDELANNKIVPKYEIINEATGLIDDTGKPIVRQVKKRVGTEMTGASVSTKQIKEFARQQLDNDARMNELFLSESGRKQLRRIIDLPDKVGFTDMRGIRSSLLADVRTMARETDKSEGVVKTLAKLSDEAIFSPENVQKLPAEAQTLLRNTNALYKEGMNVLETTFSEKLLERLQKNPSNVVAEIFPKQNPTAIKAMREQLIKPFGKIDNPQGKVMWDRLRQEWLANAVEKSLSGEGKQIVKRGAFEKILSDMGEESVNEMFPDAASKKGVENIKNLFDAISRKPPAGLSLFVRHAQTASGAYNIYRGAKENDYMQLTGGGMVLMSPYLFAKLASNQLGVKLLTAGMKAKPNSSELVPLTARLIRLAKQIDDQKKAELERAEKVSKALNEGRRLYNEQKLPPTMAEREQMLMQGAR